MCRLIMVTLLLGLLSSATASAESAVQLALKFRQGQKIRYAYTEKVVYSPPSSFMGVGAYELEANIEYVLRVSQVGSDGVARVKLTFERIKLTYDGEEIMNLTVFPKDGGSVSATIKPNGETRFYKKIYVTVNRGNQLEYRIVKGGGMMASNTKTTEGEQELLAADLGGGVVKIGLPPTRTIEGPDHAKLVEFKVDLTPRKLMDLLLLPTVPLAAGQTFSTPIAHVCNETLTYDGKADDAGFRGNQVRIDVAPWTDIDNSLSGYQPELSGSLTYLVEPSGKLVRAKGDLVTEILIPGVGTQIIQSKLDLILRK